MRGTAALRAVVLTIGIAALGATRAHAQAAASSAPAPAPVANDSSNVEEVARQHFQLGRAQYDSGQFRDAAASFERAYELSKRDLLWYNLYLAYRDAGDNPKAAEALRNYLTRVEQVDNRAQLEARLASLDRLVAEEKARAEQQASAAQAQAGSESAAATPAETQPTDQSAPPPADSGSPSIVPYVLMGVGGAMVIGGVVTGLMASSKHSELEEQCPDNRCDPSLQSLADEGKTLALTADVLLFGGIAVAAAGGVLWFIDRGKQAEDSEPDAVAASAGCGPRGCAAHVRWSF